MPDFSPHVPSKTLSSPAWRLALVVAADIAAALIIVWALFP
jgi:hypothetical protein